jgi:hypothetical protein
MPKKKDMPAPFYGGVKSGYDDSLRAFLQAAMMLYTAASNAITLADSGADPAKCLESIRPHVAAYREAAYGEDS